MDVSLLVFLISVGILWCLEIKLHVRPINMQLQPPNKKWHPNQYLSFDLMVPSPITYHRKYAPLSSNLCCQVNQCWLWSALCQRSTKTPYAAPTRPPPNIRNHNQYLIINIHWSIIYCRKHLPLSLILPQHALYFRRFASECPHQASGDHRQRTSRIKNKGMVKYCRVIKSSPGGRPSSCELQSLLLYLTHICRWWQRGAG